MEVEDGEISLSEQVRKLDGTVATLIEVFGNIQQPGHSQTVVTHKSEGGSPWAAAAIGVGVTACFFTFLSLILYSAQVNKEIGRMERQIGDLDAYRALYGGQISALQAKVTKQDEPKAKK